MGLLACQCRLMSSIRRDQVRWPGKEDSLESSCAPRLKKSDRNRLILEKVAPGIDVEYRVRDLPTLFILDLVYRGPSYEEKWTGSCTPSILLNFIVCFEFWQSMRLMGIAWQSTLGSLALCIHFYQSSPSWCSTVVVVVGPPFPLHERMHEGLIVGSILY